MVVCDRVRVLTIEIVVARLDLVEADLPGDFGFLPVRAKGRVELARLELGGLQPAEEGTREKVLARVQEAFMPAPAPQRF